ncbi:MAG: zinc metallopeptidase [Woeseiaceae bacterium]
MRSDDDTRYDSSMPVIFLIVIVLAVVFLPGLWVRRVMARYSQPTDRYSGTGAELARHLLDQNELENVQVEVTEHGDHYDPESKTVRLTEDKFNNGSLTAITVAAHEVGHAIQDKEGYAPLRIRSHLVRASQKIERFGAAVLLISPFIGALTRAPSLAVVMFLAGFLVLATSTLVHFATLPTEFDASFSRALPLLDKLDILIKVDRPHARRLLTAAALTYVAASLMSLLNIARWWAILRR